MMTGIQQGGADSFERLLAAERARLIRLCAHISGDPQAAEDLAQETLVEAWRNRHKLADHSGAGAWLTAIARNICLRWGRRRGREPLLAFGPLDNDPSAEHIADSRADFDLESLLDRSEIADLLDRALTLLPAETRRALLLRYVEELPHGEIAGRLKLADGAVAVRLHRGRLALRRLLLTELRDEAAAFGLVPQGADGWQETRIWCPSCGARRLIGMLGGSPLSFEVRCPDCSKEPRLTISRAIENSVVRGARGFREAYRRSMEWGNAYYQSVLAQQETGTAPCWRCAEPAPLLLRFPKRDEIARSLHDSPGIFVRCERCDDYSSTTPMGRALHLPAGRRFWRRHQRIRLLPEREVELHGQVAVVTSFASVSSAARYDVVWAKDTLRVLATSDVGDSADEKRGE